MRRRVLSSFALLALTIAICRADDQPKPPASPSPVPSPTPRPTAIPVPQTTADKKLETFKVHESLGSIWVDVHTPNPPEIENETQARALTKEAATALGQNAILRYVLTKRTSKGKPLSEAQIPSTEIQDGIKALITGAQVSAVKFDKDGCRLRVSVDKKNLKVILRKG